MAGTLSLEDVIAIMGMKDREIVDWFDVDSGTLVVTREGAQTLIAPDRTTAPVSPAGPVPAKGGGRSAKK